MMRWWWVGIVIATLATSLHAPARAGDERRALPAPSRDGGVALAAALEHRRSIRTYAARDLTDPEVSQLLWAAQGQTSGHRTTPSAGALYPLTIWVADARGVWRYVAADHALRLHRTGDHRAKLAAAGGGQDALAHATVILAITGRLATTAAKYGGSAERFVTLEAGHAAQNVLLTATALGLGAVPIGAFDDRRLRAALDVPREQLPLYLLAVGARRDPAR